MIKLLVVFIILLILLVPVEKVINIILRVEKKKLSETAGKNIDRWGRVIIAVSFCCLIPFYISWEKDVLKWFWILYFVILMGFQSVLEWKYLKESKQYIATLILLMVSIVLFYNIEYLVQLVD